MGRAIVRDPKLFLFDEPLSNLDAKLRVQMRGEIRRLQRRLKVTSLYVTHDQVEAMTLGDRLLVMPPGRAGAVGDADGGVRATGRHLRRGFIGSPAMNLLPGILGRDGTTVRVADADVALGPWRFDRPDGHRVVLGIRPEHVALDAAGMAWPVEVVELLGSEMLVHAGRPGEASLTLKVANGAPVGDAIRVSFPAAHIHLFDQATGLRIEPTPASSRTMDAGSREDARA